MISKDLKILVIGAGRVGSQVARLLRFEGFEVVATTTQKETTLCLESMGIEVIPWTWEPGVSWSMITSVDCSRWLVTVPPRGADRAEAFHESLHREAVDAGVELLVWTSSTSVYPKEGVMLNESHAVHQASPHSGVDLLKLEKIHRSGKVPFVAMRLGGLVGPGSHPIRAMHRRGVGSESDGIVQWVHVEDAARACAHVINMSPDSIPEALNVVAPKPVTRGSLVEACNPAMEVPATGGGMVRVVSSQRLCDLGFDFAHPAIDQWVRQHPEPELEGAWDGPHGSLRWTWTPAHVEGWPSKETKAGTILMFHGYKGFRKWGNWGGMASCLARRGWHVIRVDFSHNGHVPPFDESCCDEEAWSQNHLHYEAEEVAYAVECVHGLSLGPVFVWGHSRGGAMALLGAQQAESNRLVVSGVMVWSAVSDLLARMPKGESLEQWESSDRWDVFNSRTGQRLHHPWSYYQEAMKRRSSLDVLLATRNLTCPILAVHGSADEVVHWSEGQAIAKNAHRGHFHKVMGAGHTMGQSHPWHAGSCPGEGWEDALNATQHWLQLQSSPAR
ncbi:MAG: alpha/beta fold hydrolase [Bacteroidetes bacterium]|nr:alpha/beta fold hydrolase [Bacteroidota bacterium]MDA0902699.1 alpha/beta fold hydrolase [Bacteroidota bacterium]MDA1241780.1 alpha/beta fold hydrolase [Bacteroidota bacterium]